MPLLILDLKTSKELILESKERPTEPNKSKKFRISDPLSKRSLMTRIPLKDILNS